MESKAADAAPDADTGPVITEVLPRAGLVYSEKGNLSEVLCKPKIMPIKSASLLKMEQLERAAQSNAQGAAERRSVVLFEWDEAFVLCNSLVAHTLGVIIACTGRRGDFCWASGANAHGTRAWCVRAHVIHSACFITRCAPALGCTTAHRARRVTPDRP